MASASSSKDPRDLYLLKQKAMKYYEENLVPVRMEDILNSMFYEDPPDVYGHLVNFFSQYTLPAKLCRLSAMEVFDAQGMSTCQTEAFCTVNNMEKLMSTTTIPTSNLKVRPEDREKAELEIHDSVLAAIKVINETLSDTLTGLDPLNQEEIDQAVLSVIDKLREEDLARKVKEEEEREDASPPPPPAEEKDKKKSAKKGGKNSAPVSFVPDRPLEVFVAGSEAVSAVSQAVCACAAASQKIPVYRHVAHISRKKGAVHEFRLPLPMVTIIQAGKLGTGKSNCIKEYMVVPGIAMSIDKSIEHIRNIYNHVAKSFAAKLGVAAKYVNETGALCPTIDTPTQGLDLLQEAVNAQGLTIGEDIYIAINAAANEFFDPEKGKYEVVSGQLKTCDDMVEFWSDVVSKYPSLVAIIDPIRGEDRDAWMKLCERVSEALFVVGDNFYDRPGVIRKLEIPDPVCTSGLTMYLERMNSVSDIIDVSNKFSKARNEIIISANPSDTSDTFVVDLAVGLNARFLKVGGPCRGERANKLNRLLQIYQELEPAEPAQDTPSAAKGDVPAEGQESEQANQETPQEKDGERSEEQEEKVKHLDLGRSLSQDEPSWGHEEKSRLKLHTPFQFPLIQNPPPPDAEGEEGEKEEKVLTPSTKRSK